MTNPTKSMIDYASWEVMWVVIKKTKQGKKKKHIMIHECDHNFAEALRVYELVKKAPGRHLVTLRCKNVGHPPLPKYESKMSAYNNRGYHWCPYCMKLHKFELRNGFFTEDDNWIARRGYYCPLCDIFQENFYVRKYNPGLASVIYRKKTRGKRSKGGRRKRS